MTFLKYTLPLFAIYQISGAATTWFVIVETTAPTDTRPLERLSRSTPTRLRGSYAAEAPRAMRAWRANTRSGPPAARFSSSSMDVVSSAQDFLRVHSGGPIAAGLSRFVCSDSWFSSSFYIHEPAESRCRDARYGSPQIHAMDNTPLRDCNASARRELRVLVLRALRLRTLQSLRLGRLEIWVSSRYRRRRLPAHATCGARCPALL